MGNFAARMFNYISKHSTARREKSVKAFRFHKSFPEDTDNGLNFNNIYLPEEVVTIILSYIDPEQLLNATLVCKRWCNIIKSYKLWSIIYLRKCNKKPKKLPWYVYYCFFTTDYFDRNLLKNGNGQYDYEYWQTIYGKQHWFQIENPPVGVDHLPSDVPDFNERTSCFGTSARSRRCYKSQEINLKRCKLIRYILNKYKPHIYVSEWVAGRFDRGCTYTLLCRLFKRYCFSHTSLTYDQGDCDTELYSVKIVKSAGESAGSAWSKVELVAKDYPTGVQYISFQHEASNRQFLRGHRHHGVKMAGGVVKILFDSIESKDS